MYGGVYDWHTVEGPALRVHQGRYYCFYSGGAWSATITACPTSSPITRSAPIALPRMAMARCCARFRGG